MERDEQKQATITTTTSTVCYVFPPWLFFIRNLCNNSDTVIYFNNFNN